MRRKRKGVRAPPRPLSGPEYGSGARFRCCGRYCYWTIPLGPWRCTVCSRAYEGPVPRQHWARFLEAIDVLCTEERARLAAMTDEERARERDLLRLFFRDV